MSLVDEGRKRRQKGAFTGGWNIASANSELQDGDLYDIQNGVYEINGWISKRAGYTLFSTSAANPTKQIYGLMRYYGPSGIAQTIYVLQNASVDTSRAFKISDDGLTETMIYGGPILDGVGRFVAGLISTTPTAIYLNGRDAPWKWDGTTWAALGGTPPVAYAGTYEDNILYTLQHSYGQTRLYYSATGNIESWPAANFIDVGSEDGGIGQNIASFQHVKYIFKENSVWHLTGVDSSSFDLQPLSKTIGLAAQDSLSGNISGAFFFLGREGQRIQVYALYNDVFTPISGPIDPILNGTRADFTALNAGATNNAVGVAAYPYYILCIPTGVSSTPNLTLVFDMRTNRWTKWTNFNFSRFIIWNSTTDVVNGPIPTEMLAADVSVAKLYKLNQGNDDQGSNIDFFAKTKYFDFGDNRLTKYSDELYVPPEGQSLMQNSTTFSWDADYAYTWANSIGLPTAKGHKRDTAKIPFREGSLMIEDNSKKSCTWAGYDWEAHVDDARYE